MCSTSIYIYIDFQFLWPTDIVNYVELGKTALKVLLNLLLLKLGRYLDVIKQYIKYTRPAMNE
jgi:hypothetical protein